MDKHLHDFQVIESIHTLSGRGNHKKKKKKRKKRDCPPTSSLMFWELCVVVLQRKATIYIYISSRCQSKNQHDIFDRLKLSN